MPPVEGFGTRFLLSPPVSPREAPNEQAAGWAKPHPAVSPRSRSYGGVLAGFRAGQNAGPGPVGVPPANKRWLQGFVLTLRAQSTYIPVLGTVWFQTAGGLLTAE